ncbi:hypothetical protein [Streptomyces sp. H27-D2]|uniref:hypothetical protein n=1 Tax=Streptomyces sp. H27-D2 TaxID=3046304 RepID=UPI002DB63D3D|nr:hypothetical protein [Streptomyces sp. H27-D2]MEC4019182.1 hypothetical protein [Streptomyces sp. H27-D2]
MSSSESPVRENASAPERGSRRKKIIVPVCLGVAVLAGLGVWKFALSQDLAVAVPDRVCDNALPGGTVQELLPERGKAFEEKLYGFASPESVSSVWKCSLDGGGKHISIAYFPVLDPDGYGPEDVERDAARPGNAPVAWGDTKGFVDGSAVSLFVSCRGSKNRDILLEITTGVGGYGDKRLKDLPGTVEQVAALAAETARFVAPRVEFCEAPSLPEAPPVIG